VFAVTASSAVTMAHPICLTTFVLQPVICAVAVIAAAMASSVAAEWVRALMTIFAVVGVAVAQVVVVLTSSVAVWAKAQMTTFVFR